MFNTNEEQLKDQIEHELDIIQFLDLLDMSFRDVVEMVFNEGVSEEYRQKLERAVR